MSVKLRKLLESSVATVKSITKLNNFFLNTLTANYEITRSVAFVPWCQLRVYSFFSKSHYKNNYEYIRDFNA